MLHILVGAGVGLVLGAAGSVAVSLVTGRPVSWKNVVGGAIGGAVAGAITTATLGTGGVAAVGAARAATAFVAGGAFGGASSQVATNVLEDRPIDENVGTATAFGAGTSLFFGMGARAAAPFVDRVLPKDGLGDLAARAFGTRPFATSPSGTRGIANALDELGGAGQGKLIHLTDDAGKEGIEASGDLIGRRGIFAVSDAARRGGTAERVLRTGLTPDKTRNVVELPEEALAHFERPIPLGPYSAMKWAGGVRYAPPGKIDLATGAFTPNGSAIGPRTLVYGPDALFYATTAGALWSIEAASTETAGEGLPAPPPAARPKSEAPAR